jgi:toxin YhaV
VILVEVPRDPNALEFQLGNTLGPAYRHWRRATFLGRFRLFFRFSSAHKAIVYAWVNDETTLRKAGAHSDPYAVFNRRLQGGNPPDDWEALLREAEAASELDPAFKRTIRKTEW